MAVRKIYFVWTLFCRHNKQFDTQPGICDNRSRKKLIYFAVICRRMIVKARHPHMRQKSGRPRSDLPIITNGGNYDRENR